MDYSPIVTGFTSSFWYFIPFIILIALFKTSWFKGVFGEFQVNITAKLFLNKEDYHLIKNVTLTTDDGTTQIDHIIVSKYGIFVIETKNMKGWIFGGEKQRTWTQKIYKHTNKIQNPCTRTISIPKRFKLAWICQTIRSFQSLCLWEKVPLKLICLRM